MSEAAIKKQVESYLPLLSIKQQTLVLDVIKSLLHVDSDDLKISKEQYNQELTDAVERMEHGNTVSHKNAKNELSR